MILRKAVVAILVLSFVLSLFLGGCTTEETAKLKVVTSTSLIASIVERVGGDKVAVVNIIPPAQCPGHFDVKPSDIQQLADADIFLLHGWQGEMFSDELIASANNPELAVFRLDIQDNWMAPSVQVEAIGRIAGILSQIDATNAAAYQKAATELAGMVEAKGTEIKAKLDKLNLSSINVMCADQQAGFIQWAGFNIVAVFGRPETLTPQVVKELVDKGREGKVTLIIDNVQSGQDAGAGIAEELGINRVILSSFPGGFENTETWEKAIDYNVELLLQAISK